MKITDMDFSTIKMLMDDERFMRIFEALTILERQNLKIDQHNDYASATNKIRVYNGDTAIAEIEIMMGRVHSVVDLLAKVAAPKILGLGQGINRFPGMWEGQPQ